MPVTETAVFSRKRLLLGYVRTSTKRVNSLSEALTIEEARQEPTALALDVLCWSGTSSCIFLSVSCSVFLMLTCSQSYSLWQCHGFLIQSNSFCLLLALPSPSAQVTCGFLTIAVCGFFVGFFFLSPTDHVFGVSLPSVSSSQIHSLRFFLFFLFLCISFHPLLSPLQLFMKSYDNLNLVFLHFYFPYAAH